MSPTSSPPSSKSLNSANVIAGLLAAATGIALGLACVPFSWVRSLADRYSGDGSADPYTPALHGRLQALAVAMAFGFVGIAVFVHWFARRPAGRAWFARRAHERQALASALWADGAWWLRWVYRDGLWLIAAMVVSIAARWPNAATPLRFDEAITWRQVAALPWWMLVAVYDEPNHHVAHSLAMSASTGLAGDSLTAIRGPSWIASTLTVMLAVVIARCIAVPSQTIAPLTPRQRIAAGWAAIGCMTSLSLHSAFAEYGIYARGYSMMFLAVTVAAWSLNSTVRHGSITAWYAAVASSAAALWTIPTAVYYLAAIAIAVLVSAATSSVDRRHLVRTVGTWSAASLTLALVLYAPILVVSGAERLVANPYVRPLGLGAWYQQAPHAWQQASDLFFRDQSRWGIAGLGLVALSAAWRTITDPSRDGWRGWIQCVAVGGGWVLLCLLQRVHPPARTWVGLAIPMSVGIGLTLAWLAAGSCDDAASASHAPRRTPWCGRLLAAGLLLAIAIGPARGLMSGQSIARSTEIGACPEAMAAARQLQRVWQPEQKIITTCPSAGTFDYAWRRLGMPSAALDPPSGEPVASHYVVVCHGFGFDQSINQVLMQQRATEFLIPREATPVGQFQYLTVYRLDP